MLGKVKMSVLSYFRSPFPSTEGFSAYRMPGAAVHGPLIFAFVFVGFFLCWPDITVLCHYNPLLTLIAWGASAVVLFRPASIARFGASHVVLPAVLSAAVGTILFLVAFAMTREKD
jgi:hypothetical protein